MRSRLPVRARLRPALATLWRAVRQWSGDAAYETYLARVGGTPQMTREQFWLDRLRQRYAGPGRCC